MQNLINSVWENNMNWFPVKTQKLFEESEGD